MQIFPSTIDDHRRLTALLEGNKQEDYTYRPPEEKTLRVFLRGIPQKQSTIYDHLRLTALLEGSKEEYYTYRLLEEKTLWVVLRGIPQYIPIEDITEDAERGFTPIKVNRMSKKTANGKVDMLLAGQVREV